LHRARSLQPADIGVRNGIPCTTWARTIVDLAGVSTKGRLERALEQSQILRVFDLNALEPALAAAHGRKGTRVLRALLGGLTEDPAPTRRELERRFLRVVRQASLPEPAVNTRVRGYEVDFHWPAQGLIVETDGRATHDTAIAFERDRARDLDLELAGWHVIRISWRQLRDQPDQIISVLRAWLERA
jgi:very-short-patch-repair endonuclease